MFKIWIREGLLEGNRSQNGTAEIRIDAKARAMNIKCSAECLRSKAEHRARMAAAGKKDPGKGFRHLATCPLKQAAVAARRC